MQGGFLPSNCVRDDEADLPCMCKARVVPWKLKMHTGTQLPVLSIHRERQLVHLSRWRGVSIDDEEAHEPLIRRSMILSVGPPWVMSVVREDRACDR